VFTKQVSRKIFFGWLIVHVLVAQIGLNVFSFSCHCVKEIYVSFIPSQEACPVNDACNTSCCKIKVTGHTDHHHETSSQKHQCGKKDVQYLNASLNFVPENSHHLVEIFLAESPLVQFNFHYDNLYPYSLKSPLPEIIPPQHGKERRILQCSFIC
jgi:hypothetical protein